MGDRHDYVALDWVKGEISETLNQARQALEAFVENPGDSTRLRFCLTYIHQVHGTLQMVEFYGAALLAEEMEKLAQALMHGATSREGEALDVLMQAILQLPTYLDRVQSGRRDLPLVLLPLLNDMRTARGENLLSENALFTPDVDTGSPADGAERLDNFAADETVRQLRKLRQAMQIAHAGIIRNQDIKPNARQLGKVFARLQSLCRGSAHADLWAAYAGVVEGVEHGTIDAGAAIKQLVRQADREVRQLLDQGAAALDTPPAPELLRNLLFYVAKSPGGSPRLDGLKQRYQLKALLTEDDIANQATGSRLVGPDRSAMQSVVEALGEELLQVKDSLDLFVRGDRVQTGELGALVPAMKQIADTLAMLGLGQPRRVLLEQIELVGQLAGGVSAINDSSLMDVAGGLLYVEASLHGILGMERERSDGVDASQGSDMQRLAAAQDMVLVHRQVVQEARNALEQSREAINAFIISQWDHSQLEPVADLLNSVRGGLEMLPLAQCAAIIGNCRRYVVEQLLTPKKIPDWPDLDALADVITSVDYYLERLAEDDSERGDNILAVAAERLVELDYGLGALRPAVPAASEESLPETVDEEDEADAKQSGLVAAETPDVESGPELELDALPEALDNVETSSSHMPPDITAADQPLPADEEIDTVEPAGAVVPEKAEEADDDDFDAELIEIFVEEAGEVLETLTEYTPVWQANNDDQKARAEVRRAFHTLKGSGRMVKAGVMAELAWSVENMLNRVIDRSIDLTPTVFDVINAVRALMPELVDDFALSRQQDLPEVSRLASVADALSRGESAEEAMLAGQEQTESREEWDEAAFEESVERASDALSDTLQDDEVVADALPLADGDLEIEATPESDHEEELDPIPASSVGEERDSEAAAELAQDEPVGAEADALDQLAPALQSIALEHGLDPVLLEIFNNETQSHIEQINAFITQCEQGLPRPVSDALQRALHTLKGSAHMAGIQPIAVLATPLEKLAKDFKANLIPADQALVDLLSEAVILFEAGVAQLETSPEQYIEGTDSFLQRLDDLWNQGLAARDSSRSDLDQNTANVGLLSIFLTEGIDQLLDVTDTLELWKNGQGPAIESRELCQSLRALGEVAGDVDLGVIESLCQKLEDTHEALMTGRMELGQPEADALFAAHERLIGMMDQVAAHQHIPPADAEIAALQALLPGAPDTLTQAPEAPAQSSARSATQATWNPQDAGTDAELVDIFLEEAQEIIDSASASLQKWIADPANTLAVESLQRDLHTLKGGARMAEIPPIGDLAHELEFLYEGLGNQRYQPSPGLNDLLHACHDDLANMVEGVMAARPISDGSALIAAIKGYRARPDQPPQLPGQGEVTASQSGPQSASEASEPSDSAETPTTDPLLGMFLEEARELVAPCDELLERRLEDPAAADELVRRVQTLKGSARMAGQNALAEQSKTLESALQDGGTQQQQLQRQLQGLHEALDTLGGGVEPGPADWSMPEMPSAAASEPAPVDAPDAQQEVPAAPRQTLAAVKDILQQAMAASETGDEDQSARISGQETVKVSAKLLEELVNLAGETSIFRGRIEQQVNDLAHTLQDVDSTIERVRDQLRRLDMETQAQILSRHQEEIEQAYEDFDPLEMDRYSQLQQLSRSLFESASDLLDLKETLAAKSRDAETLLLQQARVNTELQEGLMRTRMVPFERLLPRMRRVVRQVASEVGKQVSLEVGSAEGEMDRSVLERMIGPLEHMLRNAVDHGIELPEVRQGLGKQEVGRITLDLQRQGGEIVLLLSDDGAGINLDAVRRKAIERGLMDADAELTDQEVLQFILEAGFSTADKITQISGRGVGMDVVNSEVKQLGGSMSLDSRSGKGSTFTIRLPFTVSVNRALMVYSGDDLYAIPLNTIEGIVRVSGYELEAYYSPDAPPFEYAGKQYDLRYLGDLLVTGQQPRLSGHSLPLPVILVRGAEHTVAVQVDALAGSREIVVKSVGKQFAVVPGIAGATILGDGRVVVILDLLAIIRARQALQSQQRLAAERAQSIAEKEDERATLVMVVDDSITVRKVTTRLLERHGMEVVTAKDGIEAIARLQDVHPDIMLLDIEMPRMDGFEVATLVRHDERLKDLPIVMITSRTGEKHRERAKTIGVNDYLGKPYQESQLLEAIGKLVKVRD